MQWHRPQVSPADEMKRMFALSFSSRSLLILSCLLLCSCLSFSHLVLRTNAHSVLELTHTHTHGDRHTGKRVDCELSCCCCHSLASVRIHMHTHRLTFIQSSDALCSLATLPQCAHRLSHSPSTFFPFTHVLLFCRSILLCCCCSTRIFHVSSPSSLLPHSAAPL